MLRITIRSNIIIHVVHTIMPLQLYMPTEMVLLQKGDGNR